MPNKRIDQLDPNLNPLTGLELIPIFDASTNTTERITLNTLASFVDVSTDTFVTGATFDNATDTLTLSTNSSTPIDVVINRYNRWYVPSGQTLTIPNGFQSFIYGDFMVQGTIDLQEDGQLIILNGDIILSGGTIIGSGTTYSIGLPEFNTFVTSGIFNSTTKQISFTGNYGFIPFDVDLSSVSTENFYTTGATLNGNIVEFNRNDLSNAYSVDLTTLKFTGNTLLECISDIYVTNVHSCSPLHINPNDEGDVYFGSTNSVGIDVTNGTISANTINGVTFYGDGSNLTNINNFVTTAVTLTSSQILNMGTPIELLPSPGTQNYYIIDNVIIEYSYGTTQYSLTTSPTFYLDGCFDSYIDRSLLTSTSNSVCVINGNLRNTITVGSGSGSVKIITNRDILDSNLVIGTTNGDNPTNGDGTLTIKITYKIETFGS